MKSTICALVFSLVLISVAMPVLSFAGADGPSANGSFQFALEDGGPRFSSFMRANKTRAARLVK